MLGYEIGKGLADLPVEFMVGTILSLAILAQGRIFRRLVRTLRSFQGWMDGKSLEDSILEQGKSAGVCPGKIDYPMHKLASEIRQVQHPIDRARQIHQCLGPAAMLLGLMQVAGDLEDHRDLGG